MLFVYTCLTVADFFFIINFIELDCQNKLMIILYYVVKSYYLVVNLTTFGSERHLIIM